MRKVFTSASFLSCFLLLSAVQLSGQSDIFKGIFDKEEPVFQATILPTAEEGTLMLVYYFTHSKADELEASVWIKDYGPRLGMDGYRRMVKGLHEVNNRSQDTVLIKGLTDQHFYTNGLDYRNSQSLSRKFTSKVLQENYRYNFIDRNEAASRNAVEDRPIAIQAPEQPCRPPQIGVRIDAAGYCGPEDRPAVLIQCVNCQGDDWAFSVEVKAAYESWRPLRADGQKQAATGVALRTEPLCLLRNGSYQVRVLAWGAHCDVPIVRELSTPVTIASPNPGPAYSNTPKQANINAPVETFQLPDSCGVTGEALLVGNQIQGSLELPAYSPCRDYLSYAKVRYVHPGYQDRVIDKVPLLPGGQAPFSIPLDARNLDRGIHTLQVVVYVKPDAGAQEIPMKSFWIKAALPGEVPSARPPYYDHNEPSASASTASNQSGQSGFVMNDNNRGVKGGSPTSGQQSSQGDFSGDPYYDQLLQQDIETVNVTATDPNCTSIQNLQLVFESAKSVIPLFITWVNPRCCQEEGCEYTVWAGDAPDNLRLLVKGKKEGAMIRELLPGLRPDMNYFEVVVKTSNGNRKAAYVKGEGPLYGIEDILSYHDRINPQKSDTLVAQKAGPESKAIPLGGREALPGQALEVKLDKPAPFVFQTPERPISDFRACKIPRETSMVAENPIVTGDVIKLKYDFSDPGYEYTLFFQPAGTKDWIVAPGTKELQGNPEFTFRATRYHSGKYLILTYKDNKNWGCLSAPIEKAIDISIEQ